MKNDTCVICGQKFEPRENKLYCSDSCKQTAYNERKNESLNGLTENAMPKINILYTFKFIEFKEYNEKYKNENLGIEQFCFIRKNLTGKWNIEDFYLYQDNLYKNGFFDNLNDINTKVGKEFDNFLTLFHGGNIEIITD